MVVSMKNAIFWDDMPCALVRTYVSEECIASIIRVTRIGKLVIANVPSLPILVTLIMEAICSSETPFLTRAHGVTSPKNGIPFKISIR
jgi:hypothetical protein